MNINSVQAGQLSQNAIRPYEKGDPGVDARLSSPSALASSKVGTNQASTQGIAAGINYLQEQLQTLLTSFPPFFPAGSPQRIDLIKKIQGLEDQIGKSSAADNVKKAIQENKLSDNASDHVISASIARLVAFRDAVKQAEPVHAESVRPGIIVNVKV